MGTYVYSNEIKAKAMEAITNGVPMIDAARFVGCAPNTISRWWKDYYGYMGKEGVTITFQSKINQDMVGNDDISK